MDTSAFDPNSFLDATVSEVNISRPPLPAGRDFIAVLGEPKSTSWKSKDGTKSGFKVSIPHEFDVAAMPPDVQALYAGKDGSPGITKVVIIDDVMLDLTENGMIDNAPGKNNRQRQYREALDLNKPGDTFNWRMVQGRSIRSKIKHEPYEGNIYDKIGSVAKV
jgi:hypothetical protein